MEKSMSVKLAEERIAILRADPEFQRLSRLVPHKLRGKTLGEDMEVITTDDEYGKRSGNKKTVTLTKSEHSKYEKLDQACGRLGKKYGLPWHTVFDLAIGGKPIVKLQKEMTAYLDPIVFKPKDFGLGKHYVGRLSYSLPLEMIEIMRRVEALDEQMKMEIKGYLGMLVGKLPHCRILDLEETESASSTVKRPPEIDVHIVVPVGYSSKEVAAVYNKVNGMRPQFLTALGQTVAKRRRTSTVLQQAETLRIFEDEVNIYDIVDEVYPDDDLSQDQVRRRKTAVRRSKARKLLAKRLT
jgi:hypothetical protein